MRDDEQNFYAVYEGLSEKGWCDSAGEMEYQRVLEEWTLAGKPGADGLAELVQFIRWAANQRPGMTSQ